MADNYEKLFKNIRIESPSDGLLDSILEEIAASKKHMAQRRFIFGVLTLVVSVAAFFPAIQYFNAEIMHSGFSQYISLIISDGGAILDYWQNFALLIVESLPVLAVMIILAVLLAFFASIRQIALNSRPFFQIKLKN